jgi:short-subunit dehydrogenase
VTAPRHILITGASSGIGAALARHYARAGMRLSLGGRDGQRLQEVAANCRARGADADIAALDVTDRTAMRNWILAADAQAPLDLVIANAGIGSSDASEAEARQAFGVNLDGVLNAALPAIDVMSDRARGQLALMSSLAGYRGFPDAPSYSASKAAVKALAEAWRGALAARGIRVSAVCPGFVATPLTAGGRRKPFLMSAERAAYIIADGLKRNRPRIAFPWPMALASWFVAALPAALSDRLLRPRPPTRR